MVQFFGWSLVKKDEKDDTPQNLPSFAPEIKDDGAVNVAAGGSYGTYIDLEGTVRTEAELVSRYRDLSLQPEIDKAIDDIANEAIVVEKDYIVRLNLDKLDFLSSKVKKRIEAEFEEILDLLDFNNQAYELFKRWYIDGRMYYHVIIDTKNPQNGIVELRYIDPRKIRKVREIKQEKDPRTGTTLKKTVDEYFAYYERGYLGQMTQGTPNQQFTADAALKISVDAVLHVTSGLMDQNNTMVLSYLHKAIKVFNQLRALEDATVIYRLARAPERRIFYIDVGNMPKAKAEQYLRDMMQKHKNRLVYDANTGEMRDDRKFMTMLEDYWLPRREGGKGTEISTLPGGDNLGVMDDVNYFKNKLMESLYVPVSRLNSEGSFNFGKPSEINRDEIKFSKFVARLRRRFGMIFLKALGVNLVLKGVCTMAEWNAYARKVEFDFKEDSHFMELKNMEILNNRAQTAQAFTQFAGSYVSHEWIRKNIFMQSDEDIEEIDDQITDESGTSQYANIDAMNNPQAGQGDMLNDAPPDPMQDHGFGPAPGDVYTPDQPQQTTQSQTTIQTKQ